MKNKVGIGIIGSQFISSIHVEALKSVADAEIIAVMSPTKGNAKKFAAKHEIPNYLLPLFAVKEQIYLSNGNYEKAYQISKKMAHVDDSLNQIAMLKNIDELKVKFETEKKENQILEQKFELQKKQRQRNMLIGVLLFLSIVGIGLEARRRVRNRINNLEHTQSMQEKDMQVSKARMSLLRSQMNPHFLFNSLNSIKHFIIQKSKEESAIS